MKKGTGKQERRDAPWRLSVAPLRLTLAAAAARGAVEQSASTTKSQQT